MRYNSKVISVEAFEFTGFDSVYTMIEAWGPGFEKLAKWNEDKKEFAITNPAGLVKVSVGDFVIKATDKDYYPCPAEIFHARYEPETKPMEYIKETPNVEPNR
jgi:hypothetical protein